MLSPKYVTMILNFLESFPCENADGLPLPTSHAYCEGQMKCPQSGAAWTMSK